MDVKTNVLSDLEIKEKGSKMIFEKDIYIFSPI